MRQRFVAILLAAITASACVSLQSVSQTEIPARRTNLVKAESTRWIIFFLNFDNDYVDDVRNRLSAKCPNGKVTGILTKDENIFYFLALVMKRRIEARGYCVKA